MNNIRVKNPRLRLDLANYHDCIGRCWSGTAGDVRSAVACKICRCTTLNFAVSQAATHRRRAEREYDSSIFDSWVLVEMRRKSWRSFFLLMQQPRSKKV